MKAQYEFYRMGSDNLFVKFSNSIDLKTNQFIRCVYENIQTENIKGLIEVYFAYSSMLINFNMEVISYTKLKKYISKLINKTKYIESINTKIIEIPTKYGKENGIDLAFASEYLKLSQEEIISIHTNNTYHVYMLGFLPGFCYLGGLDKRIHLPRLDTPRLKIEKGSVGIANNQTGIYPLDSPGGWRIIGKTDTNIFDLNRKNMFLVLPGDKIRFVRED